LFESTLYMQAHLDPRGHKIPSVFWRTSVEEES